MTKKAQWLRVAIFLLVFFLGFGIGSLLHRENRANVSLNASTIQAAHNSICSTIYPPEELSNAWNGTIELVGIDQVFLSVNGRKVVLIDAVKNGEVTPEELIAQAFIDARTGVCTRADWEDKGLSRFDFHYPAFDLAITMDVCKTAKREKISVLALTFYPAGKAASYGVARYIYDQAGQQIDRYAEDWGVEVQVSNVIPTSVSLTIKQKNGQETGTIVATHYSLLGENAALPGPEMICTGEEARRLSELETTIAPNDTTQLTIDWTALYGPLPAGEYTLALSIQDIFDSAVISPLTEDYEDHTRIFVPFAVQ